MKQIEILIKLPHDYFFQKSELDFLATFGGTFRDSFQRKLMDGAVEQALKEVHIPKIEIDPKEIKDRMLTILAERALEKE